MSEVGQRTPPVPNRGEVVLGVPDMDCTSCARRIGDRLEKIGGIHKVEPRVLSRDVRIEFDPERTQAQAIAEAVRALGYAVEQDGRQRLTPGELKVDVWGSREAKRTYVSGFGLAAGLALRLLGWSPPLASAFIWRFDVAALFFIAAALVGGLNFFGKGLRAARILRLDMNFLMTVAIFGALGVGELVEAGSIAFLFGLAELLERYSVERARRSIELLLDLAPATARVRRDGVFVDIPVEDVVLGDRVQVLPGEKVPIDGWVREGHSEVDQSAITGEAMPVAKAPDDYAYAGSMNQQGYLEIETAKDSGDTTLAHIIHLVEEAEASRSPSERFVDRFARYYTPTVTVLALVVMTVPPLAFGAAFGTWFVRGLTLLVISCPCALVISTPVAVVSGITSAARNGVLIKGGVHLEALADIRVVAFDKTGTLTSGELEVAEVISSPGTGLGQQDLLRIASLLEQRSEHLIARAIRRRAGTVDTPSAPQISDFQALAGRGAQARLDGVLYQIGRPELFGAATAPWRQELERVASAGQTPVCLGTDGAVLGILAVADHIRPEARAVIEELRRQGVERIVMLTGDHEPTARAVAERLSIDECHAGLLPDEKVEVVRRIESEQRVAMIGDGVNDAPALAAASVGVSMGAAASDVALETADVALMADDLTSLPYLFRLARRGESVIRQNIGASIAIKFSLAAGVFPGWVNLITAVLIGDMGASLAVTGNALRLARTRR